MNGKDYRALRRLSDRADNTRADVGETCERVPAADLPALLASGKIEPLMSEEVWRDLVRPLEEEPADGEV